jgi:hypothetical protein
MAASIFRHASKVDLKTSGSDYHGYKSTTHANDYGKVKKLRSYEFKWKSLDCEEVEKSQNTEKRYILLYYILHILPLILSPKPGIRL